MNRKYLLLVRCGGSKTILDVREISHIIDNFSLDNTKSVISMKNGREIEILDIEEFLNDLKELEEILNKENEQL